MYVYTHLIIPIDASILNLLGQFIQKVNTYLHPYLIHTYIHTYMYIYTHTYKHTYVYTHLIIPINACILDLLGQFTQNLNMLISQTIKFVVGLRRPVYVHASQP